MAEIPLKKLARLVGGAAMLPGPLGHQVLGQLLISKSTGTEVAGANVVLAAVSRQTNVAAQVVVRSMVPAVLVEALSRKEKNRLVSLAGELEERLQEVGAKSAEERDRTGRMTEAQPKLDTLQTLDEVVLIEALKLRCPNGPYMQWPEAVQKVLDEYETKDVQKQQVARSTDEILETGSDTIPEESSARGKQPADASSQSAADSRSNAMVKMKKTKKKPSSKGKGKSSD